MNFAKVSFPIQDFTIDSTGNLADASFNTMSKFKYRSSMPMVPGTYEF